MTLAPEDRERIEDQLAIERRLRALEDVVGTVRDAEAELRQINEVNIIGRLEALEDQIKSMRGRRHGDD